MQLLTAFAASENADVGQYSRGNQVGDLVERCRKLSGGRRHKRQRAKLHRGSGIKSRPSRRLQMRADLDRHFNRPWQRESVDHRSYIVERLTAAGWGGI
jgi:hypothetical protein